MLIQPIMKVAGVRIELSLEEALSIAQDPGGYEKKVKREVRTMLRGSGVDPETGEPCDSSLALEVDLDALPAPKNDKPKRKYKTTSKSKTCQWCGRKFAPQGITKHENACPERPEASHEPKLSTDGQLANY